MNAFFHEVAHKILLPATAYFIGTNIAVSALYTTVFIQYTFLKYLDKKFST